jgi:hypothetical protein
MVEQEREGVVVAPLWSPHCGRLIVVEEEGEGVVVVLEHWDGPNTRAETISERETRSHN